MFPPYVMTVSVVRSAVVLSTRQTPAVLPHSRKKPVSPGAGHGPGPPPQKRLRSLQAGKF